MPVQCSKVCQHAPMTLLFIQLSVSWCQPKIVLFIARVGTHDWGFVCQHAARSGTTIYVLQVNCQQQASLHHILRKTLVLRLMLVKLQLLELVMQGWWQEDVDEAGERLAKQQRLVDDEQLCCYVL